MLHWLKFNYLIPLIFGIGILQYGGLAINSASQGQIVLWEVDAGDLEGSGFFRYVKDGFLLVFSLSWPLYITRQKIFSKTVFLLYFYFIWIVILIAFGMIGILVGYSPPFFFVAGVRWLMLLHASIGVFVLMRRFYFGLADHKKIIYCLILFAFVDLYLIASQLAAGQSTFGLGLGQSRLTGFFSNAGVAGFFAFALAFVGMHLDGASLKMRLFLSLASLLIALSSGTRSMMISIFFLIMLQMFEYSKVDAARQFRGFLKTLFFPLFIFLLWGGYKLMIDAVDRGGILEVQLSEGGRISNFTQTLGVISTADLGEFLFGRGLGVGTNTAYSMLSASGVSPDKYRFNWLVDNAILTQFFQFGLIGSCVFWLGILSFLLAVRPTELGKYRLRYRVSVALFLLSIFSGNPFEQYFLMLPFMISFGCIYWGSVSPKFLSANIR